MKIVIAGAGGVGFQLAKQLIEEKQNVVVIEQDTSVANYVANRLDCLVINDRGNNREALKSAGLDRADCFVSVTDSDEVNMIACTIARSVFNTKKTIARVRNIEYSDIDLPEQRKLGIDHIVNPEVETAKAIVRSIDVGAMSDVLIFTQSDLQIRRLIIAADSYLLGKTVEIISHELVLPFLVVLVERGNEVLIPVGDTIIMDGDILYIASDNKTFEQFYRQIGYTTIRLRKILLVGGGKVGKQVAQRILRNSDASLSPFQQFMRSINPIGRKRLTIVDRNADKCRQVAEQFPDALVLNTDISSEDLFEEENLAESDLLIAATEEEELNIITSVYAKTIGIARSIVLVSKSNYAAIATRLGIDVVVSVKNTIVGSILKHTRRDTLSSIHSISDGKVEVLECTVVNDSQTIGKRIQDIRLPPDTLIVSLNHNGHDHIPTGEDRITARDHIIVISAKQYVERVQQLFTRQL